MRFAVGALSFIFPLPNRDAGIADHERKLEALLRHPRLEEAIAGYIRNHVELNLTVPQVIKLIYTNACFMLETVLCYLHGLKELEGRGDGATMSKLQIAAFADRFLSPRSVNTFIDRLVDIGHVERVRDGKDSRVRRIVPTEAFWTLTLARILMVGDVLPLIFPESQLSHQLRSKPELVTHVDFEVSRISMTMQNPFRQYPEVNFFLDRTGGFSLYLALFDACFDRWGCLKHDAPVSVQYSGLAQELGVSRTHFRNIVRDAIKAGVLAPSDLNDEQVCLPAKFIESGRGTMAHWLLVMYEAEQRVQKRGLFA